MNILTTLNSKYIRQLVVMLTSIAFSNPGEHFDVYIAHSSLEKEDFDFIRSHIDSEKFHITGIKVDDEALHDAPITDRYPREMYYRIFADRYLPKQLDRVLYLDPDIVVINSIESLYNIDFGDCLFAAASHVKETLLKFNEIRLNMPENGSYINSGVLMMNLKLLRNAQNVEEIYDYIESFKNRLLYPDQDVLSGIYGDKILPLDPMVYNLSDRYLLMYNLNPKNFNDRKDLNWVKNNTVIIHYYGRNKPWKNDYKGELGQFYLAFEEKLDEAI